MKYLIGSLVVLLMVFSVNIGQYLSNRVGLASTPIGGEYHSTTTGAGGGFTGSVARIGYDFSNSNAKISGTLGSVYVAAPTTGIIEFYNATTTNINLRTGNIASTTLLMAVLPAGTGTSTIPLDISFTNGLIMVFKGTVSSTTVTHR